MYLGIQSCEISFGNKYLLRGCHNLEMKKSIHQIVQTAKLELPISVLFRNNQMLESIKLIDKIKEGDSIAIAFGYRGENTEEFTGYIRRINYKPPLVLECEDNAYLFRKTNVKKAFHNVQMKDVLSWLLQQVYYAYGVQITLYDNVPNIVVNNFICNNETVLQAIQRLKDWYPMLGFFLTTIKGKEFFYAGLLYGDVGKNPVRYSLNRNTVSVDEMKYSADVPTVGITYEVHLPNGTIVKKQFGDIHGEVQLKEKLVGNFSDDTLKNFATQAMSVKAYAGYKGNLTAFYTPYVEPGMITNIDDPQFNGREGKYFVGTVTTTFGQGIRRKPEVDFKL